MVIELWKGAANKAQVALGNNFGENIERQTCGLIFFSLLSSSPFTRTCTHAGRRMGHRRKTIINFPTKIRKKGSFFIYVASERSLAWYWFHQATHEKNKDVHFTTGKNRMPFYIVCQNILAFWIFYWLGCE